MKGTFQTLHEDGIQRGDLETGVVHFAGANEIPTLLLRRLGIVPTVIVHAENTPEIRFRQAMNDPGGDGILQYVDAEGQPQSVQTRHTWEEFVSVVDSAASPYYPGSFDGDPLQKETTIQVGDVFDFTPEEFRESSDEADTDTGAAPSAAEAAVFPCADGRQKYDVSIEFFGADSAFKDSREESAALSPSERWAAPAHQLDQRWAALDCLINSADSVSFTALALRRDGMDGGRQPLSKHEILAAGDAGLCGRSSARHEMRLSS
ncbi:hypothetical protein ABZX12_26145 [Kribbella sp. NPDC003505]|uniref:hypothetical protein n=1 Tax=Kribbella sp. NPDC003505 TaxID=3154448 RepID=UPI0033A71A05